VVAASNGNRTAYLGCKEDKLRKLFTAVLLLVFAQGTFAGPLDWAKHHKRFLLMEGAAVGAALVDAHGLHHCRRTNGVEPCTAHYGEAWATFGIVAGMNVIVMPSLAEACWKDGNSGKFCYPLAYTGPAIELGYGIHEWRIKKPKEDK
jgi:hypothetical protein